MVELSGVQPARKTWPNDVWPNDRRLLDLYRQPGNCAGNVRNLRRRGRAAFWRVTRRKAARHRRAGGHWARGTTPRDGGRGGLSWGPNRGPKKLGRGLEKEFGA